MNEENGMKRCSRRHSQMKRLIISLAIFACTGLAQSGSGGSGQPAAVGRGAPGMSSNPKSNEQNKVDIDRFIGYPANSPVHLSHATLLTHSILKAGDPYTPGARGAVLEYRKDLSTATLLPQNRTPLLTFPDEFFFFVQNGDGRLDDGKHSWDLHQNLAILIPPNVPHRFINTSDKPLNMIMLTWTAAGTPKNEILVRDINLLPYCEENAHWNNTSKCIFGVNDGLMRGERIYAVMLQPWAMSQPHSHALGTEEIWTKLTPGTLVMLLGSELREFSESAAYLVPPTGVTEHANLNLSQDKVEWFLYVARGPAGPSQGNSQTITSAPNTTAAGVNANVSSAGSPNAGRGGFANNPNIIRDQASVDAATIAGKPLR